MTVTRSVLSEDPSLSAEANRMLTEELRAVIGHDSVELEDGRPDHRRDRHGTHSAMVAGAIELRLFLAMVGLMLIVVGLIALGATRAVGPALLGVAFAAMIVTAIVVAWIVMRMEDPPEHVSPETYAVLTRDGVGDPDRTFSDLVADFQPEDRGLAIH